MGCNRIKSSAERGGGRAARILFLLIMGIAVLFLVFVAVVSALFVLPVRAIRRAKKRKGGCIAVEKNTKEI